MRPHQRPDDPGCFIDVDALPILAFLAAPDGRWTATSRRFREVTGREGAALAGQGWLETVHREDRDRLRILWSGRGNDAFVAEARVLTMDGGSCWYLWRAEPQQGGDGVTGWAGTLVEMPLDRAAHRRHEGFLLRLEDRLRDIADPEETKHAAADELGRELKAGRVQYVEYDEDAEIFRVARCYTDGRMRDLAGEYRMADVSSPAQLDLLRGGRSVVIVDNRLDPLTRVTSDLPATRAMEVRAHIAVPLVKSGRLVATLSIHQGEPRDWTAEEVALVEAVAERTWAAVRRARAEAALEENEIRLAAILDALPVGVIVGEAPSGRLTFSNRGVRAVFGFETHPSQSVADYDEWEAYDEEGRRIPGHEFPMARVLATGEPSEGEYRFVRDGGAAWLRIVGAPIVDRAGRLSGGVVAAVDVDEQRRLVEHQTLLVAELSHRVKNVLAVVQGIASQTFARATSLDEFREAFEGRLQALSVAHSLLLRANWRTLPLADLAAAVLAPFSASSVSVEGPALDLGAKQGVAMALILHELATNAAKYGALSPGGGRVDLSWSETGPGRLRLRWSETSLAADPEFRREGFGSRLIRRSVENDLGGAALRRLGNRELEWEVEFPIAAGSAALPV